MIDEKWKKHMSVLESRAEIAKTKVTMAKNIKKNIDRINSFSDIELSLIQERNSESNYVRYTKSNSETVQRDPVYKRLEILRLPTMQRTTDNGYLLVEKAIEKLIDSLHQRKMTEKQYQFFLDSSGEDCVKALLCYFGVNVGYNPDVKQKVA